MSDELHMETFLQKVEKHTNRQMRYRPEVTVLLRAAAARSMEQVFLDCVFHATFVVKTRDVMKRIGAGAEGFDTLSTQFGDGLERVSTLLRTLIKEEPDAAKNAFIGRFFPMEQEGLNRLLDLLGDLVLIKHWEVDGHPLPFPGYEALRNERTTGTDHMHHHLQNLTRAARIALLLLVVLCIIDGPFTILGWVTALIVAGMLIIIQYEGAAAQKGAS